MEKCYEYLGCENHNCIMFETDICYCWEVEGTLCAHAGISILQEKYPDKTKKEICEISQCVYFVENKKNKIVE